MLNPHWKALAATALAIGGAAAWTLAQQQESSAHSEAEPSEPEAVAEDSRDRGPAGDEVDGWIERLGSPNFEERDDAIRSLRAHGKPAVPALERAAEESEDAEVRWHARKLARELR